MTATPEVTITFNVDGPFIEQLAEQIALAHLRLGGLSPEEVPESEKAQIADQAEEAATDEPADPWGPTSGGAASASSTTASRTTSTVTSDRPPSPPKGQMTYRDDRGVTHKFHEAGAPPCEHGQPAVLASGKKQGGRAWKQWRCALSSTDRWGDKCEFAQWA